MTKEVIKFINENQLYYEIFKDFIFPLLLTLISGVLAWFLFIKQYLNDKKKEKKSKKEDIKNKLTFFSMIIKNSIENSVGQNNNLRELCIEIGKSDFVSINLKKHPTYDLKLVAEKLDKENYLLSYLKFYQKENKLEILEDFKKIIDTCGIINNIFKQIYIDIENKQKFETELISKFYDGFDEFADYFGLSLVELKKNNDPLFYKLFEIQKNIDTLNQYKEYQKIKGQYILILKPTLELLEECHNQRIEFSENVGNLWTSSFRVINTYDNLLSETLRLNEMLKNLNTYISKLITDLEKSSEKLIKDFLN